MDMLHPFTKQPSSYTIQINEQQRLALIELFAANPQLTKDKDPIKDPFTYWDLMLQDLPEDEVRHPNINHFFCL